MNIAEQQRLDPTTLFTLMDTIYRHYPLKTSAHPQEHPGFITMFDLIDQKIQRLDSEENMQWKKLLRNIKHEFATNVITNLSQNKFPSYCLEIIIEKQKLKDVLRTRTFFLSLSLLVPYFTVYIQDLYEITGYTDIPERSLQHRVVYMKSTPSKELSKQGNHLANSILHQYPGYSFLPHKTLFDTQVACPKECTDMITRTPTPQRSIYDFLFSLDHIKHTDVLS